MLSTNSSVSSVCQISTKSGPQFPAAAQAWGQNDDITVVTVADGCIALGRCSCGVGARGHFETGLIWAGPVGTGARVQQHRLAVGEDKPGRVAAAGVDYFLRRFEMARLFSSPSTMRRSLFANQTKLFPSVVRCGTPARDSTMRGRVPSNTTRASPT